MKLSEMSPMLVRGSYSIREIQPRDEKFIARLRADSPHPGPAPQTPLGTSTYVERLGMELWATPTIMVSAGGPIGYAATIYCDPANLISEFVFDFVPGRASAVAIKLCTDRVLWMHPVRRLHCQRLLLDDADLDFWHGILSPSGFRVEGVLRDQVRRRGRRLDVALFGLVRDG